MKCHITGKITFGSEAKAEEYIKFLRKKPDRVKPVRYYQCEFCHGWHMTSQTDKSQPVALKHAREFIKYML